MFERARDRAKPTRDCLCSPDTRSCNPKAGTGRSKASVYPLGSVFHRPPQVYGLALANGSTVIPGFMIFEAVCRRTPVTAA